MARIRTIKPDLWADELLGSLGIAERLLFVGLISNADDEGRMRAAPAFVRSTVFPYDEDLTVADVDTMLTSLHHAGRIKLYGDGQRYLEVTHFTRHQRVPKPQPSKIPSPSRHAPIEPGYEQGFPTPLPNPSDTVPTPVSHGMEGEGEVEVEVSSLRDSSAKPDPSSQQITAVFDWWKELFDVHPSTKLTPLRRKKIRRVLRDRGKEELFQAVTGYASDPWRHEELKRHDIGTLLRSDEQVDGGLDLYRRNHTSKIGAADAALERAGYGQ